MSRLEFGSKSYSFFNLLDTRAALQDPSYSNLSYSTEPPSLPNPKPSPLRAPLLPFAVERKERRGRGREGKLRHIFVDPRRSSPKTCWDSCPLSVFPISMAFPCFLWSCRLVWCSAARLDARKKGKRSGIAVVVVVIPFALVVCKGNP